MVSVALLLCCQPVLLLHPGLFLDVLLRSVLLQSNLLQSMLLCAILLPQLPDLSVRSRRSESKRAGLFVVRSRGFRSRRGHVETNSG